MTNFHFVTTSESKTNEKEVFIGWQINLMNLYPTFDKQLPHYLAYQVISALFTHLQLAVVEIFSGAHDWITHVT